MEDQTEINTKKYWWRKDSDADICSIHLMPGNLCPECGRGLLGYDSLFVLTCLECGYIAAAGAFT